MSNNSVTNEHITMLHTTWEYITSAGIVEVE